MANALDAFRAQKEAADAVHARLTEVSNLVKQLHFRVDQIATNEKLLALLRSQQTWLDSTREALAEVRRFREQESKEFWPAVWRRWVMATVLGLASISAASAAYGWATKPAESELEALRERAEFADRIVRRTFNMTAAERRQFEALLKPAVPVGK
jgi:hypothetical protein